jgi:hypothetical protein
VTEAGNIRDSIWIFSSSAMTEISGHCEGVSGDCGNPLTVSSSVVSLWITSSAPLSLPRNDELSSSSAIMEVSFSSSAMTEVSGHCGGVSGDCGNSLMLSSSVSSIWIASSLSSFLPRNDELSSSSAMTASFPSTHNHGEYKMTSSFVSVVESPYHTTPPTPRKMVSVNSIFFICICINN